MAVEKRTAGDWEQAEVAGAAFLSRSFLPAIPGGWPQLAMGEWELRATGFGDCHPHDEVNYILEGELEVECEGEVVRARTGEVIRVPAGSPAFYRAHQYARMLYVYGPNPDGAPSGGFPDPRAPRPAPTPPSSPGVVTE